MRPNLGGPGCRAPRQGRRALVAQPVTAHSLEGAGVGSWWLPGSSGNGGHSSLGHPALHLSERLWLFTGSPGPASDHGSRACSPLFDSGLHLNGNPSSTVSAASLPLTVRGYQSAQTPRMGRSHVVAGAGDRRRTGWGMLLAGIRSHVGCLGTALWDVVLVVRSISGWACSAPGQISQSCSDLPERLTSFSGCFCQAHSRGTPHRVCLQISSTPLSKYGAVYLL